MYFIVSASFSCKRHKIAKYHPSEFLARHDVFHQDVCVNDEAVLWIMFISQKNVSASHKKRNENWSRVDLKKPPNAWRKREKIGHYKLGNKNIKQHDILYRCYQFTHKRRRGRDNKPQRKIETKTTEKKILKMRNLLKMEHSFICVLQNRDENRWELWKDKNQENYKRGNVSRLNILFVFLFFHQEKESEDSGRQEKFKKKVEERKI